MRKILITGGKGFIGSYIDAAFTKLHDLAYVYDLVDGYDILNYDQLNEFMKGKEIKSVYHLAGQVEIRKGEQNPYLDIDLNLKGTYNTLKVAFEHQVTDFTLVSSASAETLDSNYGITKRAAEHYALKFANLLMIPSVKIVRYSSVFGPNRLRNGEHQGPVNNFIYQALTTGTLDVWGNPEAKRDIIYVEDAAMATIFVGEHGWPNRVYNIGNGVSLTIKQIAEYIATITDADISYRKEGKVRMWNPTAKFDCRSLYKLGWKERYGIFRGIRETVDWMKQYLQEGENK